MRQLIAIGFRGPKRSFVKTFPDLPECVAFAESLESVRAAAAEGLAYLNEAPQPTPEPRSESSPLEVGSRARGSLRNDSVAIDVANGFPCAKIGSGGARMLPFQRLQYPDHGWPGQTLIDLEQRFAAGQILDVELRNGA
jgi:predicted RNase H-like HicB family nuclease